VKFKGTLILLVSFLVLLAVFYVLEFRSGSSEEAKDKLVVLSSDDVENIVFNNGEETIRFQKKGEDWLITEPLEAKADRYEVNRLADDFSDLRFERVVEEQPADLEKYGIPQKEVTLYSKGSEHPVHILIGMENPLDNTYFAKREDEERVVLIPSMMKSLLEKKLVDFRKKDIFHFETDQAKKLKVRAKNSQWEAEKVEEEWFLRKPVEALAKKSQINDILYSLSNLKAKEFVVEEKTAEDAARFGLNRPQHEVTVDLPLESQKLTITLSKREDKLYATSSLSTKIIQVEDSILSDLEKPVEDLREKKVFSFYTWEAKHVEVQTGAFSLGASKDEEENWRLNTTPPEEADKDKIQSFLRKIEDLEAEAFIDPPFKPSDYGLDSPQATIIIQVQEDEEKTREMNLVVGKKEEGEQKVFVKNARFPYLFRVDAGFLEELPQKKEDWKPAIAETEEKQEKEKG